LFLSQSIHFTHEDTSKHNHLTRSACDVTARIHHDQWISWEQDVDMATLEEDQADRKLGTVNVVSQANLQRSGTSD